MNGVCVNVRVKNRKTLTGIIAGALSILVITAVVLKINDPDKDSYPVRGVDVSSYQGEIDWQVLSEQDIDFAYIKATEGSSYKDPYFDRNFAAAAETQLRIGAYHFFSFESSGMTQAENFCSVVPGSVGMLPPVIDVEYYGEYGSLTDDETLNVQKELRVCVDRLSEYYGVSPVIYATRRSYRQIIQDKFDDCGMWLRSVYLRVPGSTRCTFWQYSDKGRLDGYSGEEKYIDLNVFCGTREEFESYGRKNNNSVS